MRFTLQMCLTYSLILSTTLVGCSLLSCQPQLRDHERPGRTSVTVTIESPPLKAQQNLSKELMKTVFSSREGQALLQRALMRLYLENQGLQPDQQREIPTWGALVQASASLKSTPTEEQLQRLYERRHPQGQALRGVQLTLSSSKQWSKRDWARFEASLRYWARTTLARARQERLQGAETKTVVDAQRLTLLQGDALNTHIRALPAHLQGSIKRLRAGEVSTVMEHEEGACLYQVEASPEALKRALPHAVSGLTGQLKHQLSQENSAPGAPFKAVSRQGVLLGLCVDISLTGLGGTSGRSFDQWLRAQVTSLKALGALNQSTLDAFGLRAEPLKPEEWPPELLRALVSVQLPAPSESMTWRQAESSDTLWLVHLSARQPISLEEARAELVELYIKERTEKTNLRLIIEQSWEELSPRLLIQAPNEPLEELELTEPNL